MERITEQKVGLQSVQNSRACLIHPKKPYEFLCVNSITSIPFKCVSCVIEEEIEVTNLLLMDSITDSNRGKTVFNNWPINSKLFLEQIRKTLQNSPTEQELQTKIQEFFKQFKSNVINQLDEIESNLVKQAYQFQMQKATLNKLYNDLCAKDELNNQIENAQGSFNHACSEINAIFDRVRKKPDEMKFQLQLSLDKTNMLLNEINLTRFDEVAVEIQQLLKKMKPSIENHKKDVEINNSKTNIIEIEPIIPFIRSELNKSSNSGVIIENSKETILKLMKGFENEQVVSQMILNNKAGYVAKIQFDKEIGKAYPGCFLIGLIPSSRIDSKLVLFNSPEAGFSSHPQFGSKQIVRGTILSGQYSQTVTKYLEFRWCIASQQFYFSDRNENINQVNPKFIDTLEQYRFAISFSGLSTEFELKIVDFKEIDPSKVSEF